MTVAPDCLPFSSVVSTEVVDDKNLAGILPEYIADHICNAGRLVQGRNDDGDVVCGHQGSSVLVAQSDVSTQALKGGNFFSMRYRVGQVRRAYWACSEASRGTRLHFSRDWTWLATCPIMPK